MFGIMGDRALFQSGDAGIVDDDVGDWQSLSKPKPISLLPNIELLESTTDLECRLRAGSLIQIGDDDVATFCIEACGDGSANATRSASDDAYFPVQFLHSPKLPAS